MRKMKKGAVRKKASRASSRRLMQFKRSDIPLAPEISDYSQ